ncbi:hypothetical protein BAUCODRAFT_73871 [Baudoinia panamericana UAMH 10762]|uniref:PIN domain-like protein n=1 Tax=Baudoinia panamericana (strain UAMH 10762) TaxID=717646 RepID=M2MCT2_BAUPA|nr:uncharacterized protein BAUCODRAFT_73871 [Baudoinia panamericana UAMH 10762]EMC94351.1 hypothetical protein BAUCODRAFT_73871 [Baudoinia panamericana UAMH 10762]
MGVTGLWQILQPCARPIKIETLNRKRLAVDASIWIYQFLKAVRDKEGNALRNSHVVGFFRRICKLLFYGIKPVFVFDGGAPALKRATITARKRRREGRRDDAVRTAGKLLAVQMQRRAEEDEQKRKAERDQAPQEDEVPDEGLVYVDEIQMSAQERQQNRKFRKRDAYHLPELDVSMNEMGGPNDPRVMSLADLEAYAKQFESGEDINVYDFSKIDYDSPFFTSLPASDRYNILNAARLRSRLRMGHSKEQLDSMFPDRMAFSKFQIERVKERNELTTRLMNINDGDIRYQSGSTRVAGEKAREYVLVKNDGVEGGWALGVISDEGRKQETAIDLDKPVPVAKTESSDSEEEGFEDVPIEGLNRLPKRRKLDSEDDSARAKQRQASHESRQRTNKRRADRPVPTEDPDSLFVADVPVDEGEESWEEVDGNAELFGEAPDESAEVEEDEELRRAIAMSMEQEQDGSQADGNTDDDAKAREDWYEAFKQRAAEEARPVPKGSARAIANILNKRAHGVAPESHEITSFGVPVPKPDNDDGSEAEDSMDLQAALAESRRGKRKASPPPKRQIAQASRAALPKSANGTEAPAKKTGFSGPLPFESLDLGSSLLGKKKMQQRTEEAAGGFEKAGFDKAAEAEREAKKVEPLPPWFSGNLDDGLQKQSELEREDRERAKEFNKQFRFQSRDDATLRRQETGEVIDVDAEDERPKGFKHGQVIDLEADETGRDDTERRQGGAQIAEELTGKPVDDALRMGDMADAVRVEPPVSEIPDQARPMAKQAPGGGPFAEEDDSGDEDLEPTRPSEPTAPDKRAVAETPYEEETLEWSDSDREDRPATRPQPADAEPAVQFQSSTDERHPAKSPSPDFEDVDMSAKSQRRATDPAIEAEEVDDADAGPVPASGLVAQQSVPEGDEDFDDFSDPEEEAMLAALAQEAEEHARFASTLNNKSAAENIAEYEKELKQLRNQQKKDRRDADEVTHIMVTECQQLLRLFGLPYVTAPMEAEAQCAELVRLGLVDGIVTDDSDCFLFGGTRIYKNMFNQAKFVECYLSSDLEKEFDLTRQKLIAVAHLLGSDYTEGLPSVGPVTALEILGEFVSLSDFKDWWNGVQMNIIPKDVDKDNAFRKKFRKNATKLFLPPAFPDKRVDVAYETPEVDSDPQPFQWGVPDLDALRSFLMATIGWSQERTDEVLVPVIRDMNRRADEGTQANITAFFDGGVGIGAAGTNNKGEAFAPRKRVDGSKRMGKALGKMAERAKIQRTLSRADGEEDGGAPVVDMSAVDLPENGEAAVNGRAGTKAKRKATKRSAPAATGVSDEDMSQEEDAPQKAKKRTTAPRKARQGRRKQAVDDEDD